MIERQSYGGLNGKLISILSVKMVRPFANSASPNPADFSAARLSPGLLARPADFTGTQARLPGSFMIGEDKHPSTTRPRRGAAIGSAVSPSSPVSPHHIFGNSHSVIPKGKPFAPKQLQLTPGAAAVSADSSVG